MNGVEIALRARWPGISARGGWALQKARGLAAGSDTDSATVGDPALTEYPLAFDRRHSLDLAFFAGRAGGAQTPWSGALTVNAQSGFPLLRLVRSPATQPPPPTPPIPVTLIREVDRYLPWTWSADLRMSWDFATPGWCGRCRWRALADGRNVFNRKNIIALRRETASLAPTLAEVERLSRVAGNLGEPIPRESPNYTRLIDLNRDGYITSAEFNTARFAAALDRFDPSLYYGEARQLRLGIEVVF